MSNFTPQVYKEYEFDGDTVKVTFSRLKRKHMLRATPAINKLQSMEDVPDSEKFGAMADVLDSIIDAIPEYVHEFEGLTDSQGQPVSIQTVVDDFYFLELASRLAGDMVEASAPLIGNSGN